MRRILLIGAVVLSMLALVPGAAQAEDKVVHGSVAAPTATFPRVQRCATQIAPDAQGTVGWTIRGVTPGKAFTVTADDPSGFADFDISFYNTLLACEQGATGLEHNTVSGDEQGIVPAGATVALVTLHSGRPGAFTYRESAAPALPTGAAGERGVTVVAVIDNAFSPYHFDFVGHKHPWNNDAHPANDIDFGADPSTYVSGMPATTPINITVPTDPNAAAATIPAADLPNWETMKQSTAEEPHIYRFPGTKVIGAMSFDGEGTSFFGDNSAHGTRSAASAAGNIHGTCPECVFVLIQGGSAESLAWAASQPWIDVITNSYGHSFVGRFVPAGLFRDNIWLGAPLAATRKAVEDGKTIVFSAGNGLFNAFDVPAFTYWSGEKGPDWMVTVGAIDPRADQQYSGAGKPVDVSSYGSAYPSSGGTTANGTGTHSGTSNAAPVTAGSLAKIISTGRSLLGDTTEGHAAGVVASGDPVPCGDAVADCPLGDGVLTRAEVHQTLFHNVLPSKPGVTADTVWPSTEHNYYYQGHGVVSGRMNPLRYLVEQQRFTQYLTGDVTAFARPKGEQNWMVVDSKCRQQIWGTWSGGYYTGATPALDPVADPLAHQFNEACSRTPVTFAEEDVPAEG